MIDRQIDRTVFEKTECTINTNSQYMYDIPIITTKLLEALSLCTQLYDL